MITADARSKQLAMVVDDEEQVRGLVARWLRDAGYQCFEAANCAEASDRLREQEIALVTLDLNMPGGSGMQLLEWINDQYPDTAVIMLTAEQNTDIAVHALMNGASGYLIKPVDRQELEFHVRRALERRELLLEKRNYTRQLERRVRQQTRELRSAYEEAIQRLVTACTYRDVETGGHVRRTGLLSEVLARAAGWSTSEAEHMRLAAPMHDVGKIGIPDAILRKPGRLTTDEFEIMKQHTLIGAEMLSGSESAVLQLAQTIALCHHEQWNGRGYPGGLRGFEIPEAARIVSIVDVYDALTHGRIYRPAMSEAEALAIMIEKSGSHFDPNLLELFLGELPAMREICAQNQDGLQSRSIIRARPAVDLAVDDVLVY